MITAPLPDDEGDRLAALIRYEILDSEAERAFDELTELASEICDTPISLISLVDTDRQWFKSKYGLDANETARKIAFCSHTILQDDVLQVEDTLDDERFADNPLVTSSPDIRFYAGAPLKTDEGHAIGTLCVIDSQPKQLSDLQVKALNTLARQVISQLELRLHNKKLERMNKVKERLYATLAHDLRSPFNGILGLASILAKKAPHLPTEKIVDLSEQILSSATNVFQVLDEILQWAQQQLGVPKVNLSAQELVALANASATLLAGAIDSKNITLTNNIPKELLVTADAALTKTVFRNLMANAIKYSKRGGKITLDCKESGNMVYVSVQDEGVGMSDDIKKSLFAASVASQQGTGGEQGSGLGLGLCKAFMELQGGSIAVDEDYAAGAKIVFGLRKGSH